MSGTATGRPRIWRAAALAGVAALGLAAAIVLFSLASSLRKAEPPTTRAAVEDLSALPPAEAEARADEVVEWALGQVYAAFELAEEAAIYDALATAAAGEALDTLYLQRRAALADRGLDSANQVVHEIEVLSVVAERDSDVLRADARWRVLGIVGHERHRHMRGNAYTADLELSRIDGAWRITGFDLRDVNRTEAGVMVEAPPGHDAPSR